MQALIFIEASGKANAWSRITRKLGMTADVVPTSGHVCAFPDRLFPIGINLAKGAVLETTRKPSPEKQAHIIEAVSKASPGTAIVIATDNDIEGDVIAYDVADIILRAYPERSKSIVRVRPGPITVQGVRASLATAMPIRHAITTMTTDAVPGRARAVTDRWIGATFSRLAGVSVGRVRSAILGAVFLNKTAPDKLQARPQTGEITLQARSSTGGRPFVARVPLTGDEPKERVQLLTSLATRYAMRIIPGTVRPLQSLSAAIAPREGTVRPFTTAEVLVHASRHHGISVTQAAAGLQDAYLNGMISYPRTDSRSMSAESAAKVTMLGFGCGLEGLDVDVLSSDSMILRPAGIEGAHEGLHPVMPLTTSHTDELRELIRRPLREPQGGWDRNSVTDAMTALVARRAFEASREIFLERGNWSPDNGHSDISQEDMEVLRDLEWFRDTDFKFPWTRLYATGVKEWPLDAVLLEIMAEEGIGRPSTYAAHIATAVSSGDIEPGAFPNPPRPTPQGINVLKKTPGSVWNPAVCRMIEDALENKGNRLGEDGSMPLAERVRFRILAWLKRVPAEFREPLLEALKEASGSKGIGDIVKPAVQAAEAVANEDTSPFELASEMADPTPYSA